MDQMMTSFLLSVEDLLTHVPSTKSLLSVVFVSHACEVRAPYLLQISDAMIHITILTLQQ